MSFLSKFAGIDSGRAKNLLSLLAPLILSMIAKQFAGKPLTPSALSSFFAEQVPNINAALPSGFSLASIPGFSTEPGATPPRPVGSTAPAESSGLPGWLLPLVGLALLAGLAWYFFGQPAEEPAPRLRLSRANPGLIVGTLEEVRLPGSRTALKAQPPAPKIETPAVPEPAKIGTDLGAIYTSLTDLLGGVKDVPTAESAVPKLKDLTPRIDGLRGLWDKLPDAGKAELAKVTTDHLAKLKELVGKVLAIPGVSDKLKPVVDMLIDKLAAFAIH